MFIVVLLLVSNADVLAGVFLANVAITMVKLGIIMILLYFSVENCCSCSSVGHPRGAPVITNF